MKKQLLTAFLLALGLFPANANRYQSLLNARHFTISTLEGTTYYYIISSESTATLRLNGDNVVVERDTFKTSDIKGMRMEEMPRFVLDEDSMTFGNNYSIDHGLLALKKTLNVNKWNSIVLPVELTGDQVRDAFGLDAMVAKVRGFREGDNTVVEYETIELNTRQVVMLPNVHYIIKPTREADLGEGLTAPLFGRDRPKGPLYLIASVSLNTKQSPSLSFISSEDGERRLMQAGTYTAKNGKSATNRKLAAGTYYLNDNGQVSQGKDSVALKAFSSWYNDIGNLRTPLTFYIDGIGEDLTEQFQGIMAERTDQSGQPSRTAIVYDLLGRRCGKTNPYHAANDAQLKPGIYIVNGKKIIVK